MMVEIWAKRSGCELCHILRQAVKEIMYVKS